MKEKIIEIIGFGMEPERAELKACQIIILFNQRILDKLKECKTGPVGFEELASLFIKEI